MSRYHSFDRREAESRALALERQRRRAAAEHEEHEIWGELVQEQLTLERSRSLRPRRQRVPRPRPPPKTSDEIGLEALSRCLLVFDSFVEKERIRLRATRVSTPEQMYELLWTRCVGTTLRNLPETVALWAKQASRMLGDVSRTTVNAHMRAARVSLRATARAALAARPDLQEIAMVGLRHMRDKRREKRRRKGEKT